jgi:hypothetical protein
MKKYINGAYYKTIANGQEVADAELLGKVFKTSFEDKHGVPNVVVHTQLHLDGNYLNADPDTGEIYYFGISLDLDNPTEILE